LKYAEQTQKPGLPIEQEYLLAPYRWFTYAPDVTGLRLICLEDSETSTVVTTTTANPHMRTAAQRAWAGARQSRAAGLPWDILHEMGAKGVDPDQKIEEMFRGYGHASVGDMARLAVDFGRVPMHLCLALFNVSSLNSGQEKSTRYQPTFGKALLHPIRHYLPAQLHPEELARLETHYQSFGALSLELFAKHKATLLRAFESYFQADKTDPQQRSALTSRVLDCVRSFLLFGQWSGMSFETSARDWSRIISELKASPLAYYRRVASQLERLLAPSPEEEAILGYKAEAPGLIRHTEPLITTNANLAQLQLYLSSETDLLQQFPLQYASPHLVQQHVELLPSHYTEGERLLAEYIQLLWPGLEILPLLDWLHNRDAESKRTMSKLIFAGHSNYNELPTFARTTRMTLIMKSFLGELRDFNRHRAWGRFFPLPLIFGQSLSLETAQQILAQGYGLPLYLSEIPAFAQQRTSFEHDLHDYYARLQTFLDQLAAQYGTSIDYTFLLNLLPLAHQVSLWMHGDPKQATYLTFQRSRPGGHINYRALAYEANQLLAASDPYLSAIQLDHKPDPASRLEFFDRS
jgi:hypothetical protein